jgi:hypothetical protein
MPAGDFVLAHVHLRWTARRLFTSLPARPIVSPPPIKHPILSPNSRQCFETCDGSVFSSLGR